MQESSVEDARRIVKGFLDKAEMAARKAIELDPQNAVGYSGMAQAASNGGKWAIAEDYAKKALELDPNDPEALLTDGATSRRAGYVRRSLLSSEKLRTLEPLIPGFNLGSANSLLADGQIEAAIAVLESLQSTPRRNMFLARTYAIQGRYAEAADTVLSTRTTNAEFQKFFEDTAQILRSAPAKVADLKALPAYMNEYNFVYAHVGAIDRVMEYAEREVAIGYLQDLGNILWLPDIAPLRKTERFKAYMRNTGLVDYWRARGWPDLCKPVGANDFACD